jgi:hypothetical protein
MIFVELGLAGVLPAAIVLVVMRLLRRARRERLLASPSPKGNRSYKSYRTNRTYSPIEPTALSVAAKRLGRPARHGIVKGATCVAGPFSPVTIWPCTLLDHWSPRHIPT